MSSVGFKVLCFIFFLFFSPGLLTLMTTVTETDAWEERSKIIYVQHSKIWVEVNKAYVDAESTYKRAKQTFAHAKKQLNKINLENLFDLFDHKKALENRVIPTDAPESCSARWSKFISCYATKMGMNVSTFTKRLSSMETVASKCGWGKCLVSLCLSLFMSDRFSVGWNDIEKVVYPGRM